MMGTDARDCDKLLASHFDHSFYGLPIYIELTGQLSSGEE